MSQVKRFLASTVLASLAVYADAAELIVEVSNVPASGQLVFQVYDSANAFGDFRDPAIWSAAGVQDLLWAVVMLPEFQLIR